MMTKTMTSLKLAAIVHAATGTIEITKEKEMQSLLDAVVDRFTDWPKDLQSGKIKLD